jgi:hypothetical protein
MNGKTGNSTKSSCSSSRTPLPEIKKSALLYFKKLKIINIYKPLLSRVPEIYLGTQK